MTSRTTDNLDKHTPGPWLMRDAETVVYIQSGRASRIADVHSFSRGLGPERHERDANARLIAAAPALLDALRKTLRCLEDFEVLDGYGRADVVGAISDARAAITKAIG